LETREIPGTHGGRPVGKYHAVKDEGTAHFSSVSPVVFELHGDRGKGGTNYPFVHMGIVSPVVGIQMVEQKSTYSR
jgi:hypothetical protein